MARADVSREEIMQLVIEEVDDARDIYQLAEQFAGFLPIRSMDELIKATDGRQLRFRNADFDVESLAGHIPTILFPVDDIRGLVERLGHIVRLTPAALGVDLESPEGTRRRLRHTSSLGNNLGLIERNNAAASAIAPGLTFPDSIPNSPEPDR